MLRDYKKIKINNRVMTVIKPEEVLQDKTFQTKFTAVEINGVILPVKTSYDPTSPGFYIMDNGNLGRIVNPSEEDMEEYSVSNAIDFSNIQNMKDLIKAQDEVKKLEEDTLINSENAFKPTIREDDDPEMWAVKTALHLKNMNIDNYADRFEENFNNDKRLLKGKSITNAKLKSICPKLDMKVTLTISDMHPDVPNPIGKDITVVICGDGNDVNEEE